jgi:hypothetical protein
MALFQKRFSLVLPYRSQRLEQKAVCAGNRVFGQFEKAEKKIAVIG